MYKRFLWASIVFFIFLLFTMSSANAAPITYQFQGKVTIQDDNSGYGPPPSDFDPDQFIAVNDTLIGSLTFDPDIAILVDHNASYNQYQILMSYELTFSQGYHFYFDSFGSAWTGGDNDSTSVSVFSMGSNNNQNSQGYDMWISDFSLRFNYSEGFDSNNLNMPNFLVDNIIGQDLYAIFWGAEDSAISITASVTSANPVPEPATMILIGSGIICLAGYRKKKYR